MSERFIELDAARGVAIIMMVIFHLVYDLAYLQYLSSTVYRTGFFYYFGLTTTILFIGIAGVSVTISGSRAEREKGKKEILWKFLRRGLGLILLGMLISLCTYLFLGGSGYVVFGILHLIGVCVILTPFFLRLRFINALIGFCIILITPLMTQFSGPFWLIPIGIHPDTFYSVDYEPMLPWFGVFLLGMGIGSLLYPNGITCFRKITRQNCVHLCMAPFAAAGRHSLIIYLLHQPVIISILIILGTLL